MLQKIKKHFFLAILVLLFHACSASPTKENADYYTFLGYHDYAIKIISLKAKEGEPWAMLRMGNANLLGHGVVQNYQEALKWYEKTAFVFAEDVRKTNEGYIALYHMSNIFLEGKGVDVDVEKAYKYIKIVYDETDGKHLLYCCEDEDGGRIIAKEMIEYTYFKAKEAVSK